MNSLSIDRAITSIDRLFNSAANRLAVAVSGGSDSSALLLLAHSWAQGSGTELNVVSVDHQLRPEAKDECKFVSTLASELGLPHTTLVWNADQVTGNIPQSAREGRYRLMGEWAMSRGIDTVCLGHTLNDQAETVLMQLSRKAGVDGLSGMPETVVRHGVTWLRPLLDIQRQQLRNFLIECGRTWVDDPTNQEAQYDRIKIRNVIPVFEQAGITVEALATIATNMQRSKRVIDDVVRTAADELVSVPETGEIVIAASFWELHDEIQVKLLSKLIQFLGGETRPRRGKAVRNCLKSARQLGSGTVSFFCVKVTSADDLAIRPDRRHTPNSASLSDSTHERWTERIDNVPSRAPSKESFMQFLKAN